MNNSAHLQSNTWVIRKMPNIRKQYRKLDFSDYQRKLLEGRCVMFLFSPKTYFRQWVRSIGQKLTPVQLFLRKVLKMAIQLGRDVRNRPWGEEGKGSKVVFRRNIFCITLSEKSNGANRISQSMGAKLTKILRSYEIP